MARIIFHVDFDAFYASVEQRENPSWRGRPLIIGADPKDGKGRGVVVACSYEAREYGIRSGQPISRAFKLCRDGVYVRPNFDLYGEVSTDVMEFLRKFADKFEQASIDETYLDVTGSSTAFGGPVDLAKRIKTEVKDLYGLTCSIGIAPNKSAAKIASDFQKPDGLTYVETTRVKEFLAPLPISKISGIGQKTELRLNGLGIRTIGDLANYPPKKLYNQFGKSAVWLWAIANAEERVEVQETYVMKSIGAEHTFEEDTDDWPQVDSRLLGLVETVHKRLLEEGMTFRTVTLKIRFKGFETYTRSHTIRYATAEREVIVRAIRLLSEEFKINQRKVRLVGVRLSGLEREDLKSTAKGTLDSFGTSKN